MFLERGKFENCRRRLWGVLTVCCRARGTWLRDREDVEE